MFLGLKDMYYDNAVQNTDFTKTTKKNRLFGLLAKAWWPYAKFEQLNLEVPWCFIRNKKTIEILTRGPVT